MVQTVISEIIARNREITITGSETYNLYVIFVYLVEKEYFYDIV